jgi:hypothetical protein
MSEMFPDQDQFEVCSASLTRIGGMARKKRGRGRRGADGPREREIDLGMFTFKSLKVGIMNVVVINFHRLLLYHAMDGWKSSNIGGAGCCKHISPGFV